MGVNTTGIQTNVNCALPNQLSVTPSSNLTNTSILSATSIDGCSMQLTLNLSDSSDLYGVVNVPNCGSTSTNVAFQPVRRSFSSRLECKHEIFILDCLGFLLVFATEPEQFGRRFLSTAHTAFRRERQRVSQQ
jgi:hypothetical protein